MSRKWVAEVTGGALIGAIYLYSSLRAVTVSPHFYEIVVTFAILQSAFLVWRDEERRRVSAEELGRANAPELRGEIGWHVESPHDNWPILVVNVRIINLGSPTVVDRWVLRIKLNFKNGNGETRTFQTEQFTTERLKTRSRRPLHTGEALEGLIIYTLNHPEDWDEENVKDVEVRFSDFLHRAYVAKTDSSKMDSKYNEAAPP